MKGQGNLCPPLEGTSQRRTIRDDRWGICGRHTQELAVCPKKVDRPSVEIELEIFDQRHEMGRGVRLTVNPRNQSRPQFLVFLPGKGRPIFHVPVGV